MRKQVLRSHLKSFRGPKPVRELGKVFRFIEEEIRDPFLAEELRRQLRDFENRLNFSAVMALAYPRGIVVYDIDSIAFKVLEQDGNFVGLRPLGAFELKWKSKRTLEQDGLPVNGMQYFALEMFSRAYGIPMYYIVNIGWEKVAVWKVGDVTPRYEVRKEGYAKDWYAIIDWWYLNLISPRKLPTLLRQMIEGKEVIP
ncbi:hypothetical protein [Pyrococcus kukulkanii]|uniref:Restriction endonuclease n=1 Tax=Pyrococcus kukulkanii TaxID=1609559 RepID=A0ABV4T6D4_9EURY